MAQHYSMVKIPCAEPGDKRKHNNVDLRTGEKLQEEGDENNEQFGNTEIETGDVVSWF